MAMLRLTSSAVVSNALRAISAPRIMCNVFIGSHQVSLPPKSGIFPVLSQNQQFSTGAKNPIDDKLVKILKSEIKSRQLSLGETEAPAPAGFPFTMEYSSCGQRVTLRRELNGEKIEALVTSPVPGHLEDDESDDSDDDDSSDNSSDESDSEKDRESDSKEVEEEEKCCVPHVHMMVAISKINGKKLELAVSAAAHRLIVSGISVVETSNQKFGPYFVEIESDMQYALREYLEVRGFDKSIGGFLYNYMVCKAREDPVGLLKKVKKFVRA